MIDHSEPVCAVWFWQYGAIGFELYEDEHLAAYCAMGLEDRGEASVAGVQFSDGRVIERDAWPMYQQVEDEQRAEWKAQDARRAANPPRRREVAAPTELTRGERRQAIVWGDVKIPSWLGEGTEHP